MAALEVTGPAPYKDRHTGLIVVGMLNVFIGLCGLGAAMGVLDLMLGGSAPARAAGHSPALPLRDLLPWLTYLLVFAVGFVWLGIGSMMARRWARTLLLIVFWLWLLGGVVICLGALLSPGELDVALPWPGAAAPAQTGVGTKGCVVVVLVLCFVVLPLILLRFYRSRDVLATCEARDPKLRWTDRCPSPVLGLSLVFAVGAARMLQSALHGALPVFGRVLSGPTAVAVAVGVALPLALVARETYRLRDWAWWAALVLALVGTVSSAVTLFSSISRPEIYRALGGPAAQVAPVGLDRTPAGAEFLSFYFVLPVATLGYLLWVRRSFQRARNP